MKYDVDRCNQLIYIIKICLISLFYDEKFDFVIRKKI